MKKLLLSHKLLVIFITIFYVQSSYAQTTYTVTSTTVGPSSTSGTFLWAVEQANTNPGADIIEFTPGLQVDANVPNVTPATSIMAHITESVTIDGKGGALNGIQTWYGAGGIVNSLSDCPGSVSGTFQLAYMPGFVEIGTQGADNSAIDVSIKNLAIKQFNAVAQINKNASLILDNFTAEETWATFECISVAMIQGYEGSSLTINNSSFNNSHNWGVVPFAASINMTTNAGDLIIENSRFFSLNDRTQPAIIHYGATGSKLNIVSSRFYRAGGIQTSGGVETNIVNSIWVNKDNQVPATGDLIINGSSGNMNIIASSIMWNTNECDGLCQSSLYTDLIQLTGSGNINLIQSAIGFNYPPSVSATALLNTLGINGGTGVFTADIYTYIQPTTQQDAAALKTITSQPALLTGTAFNSPVTPLGGIDFEVELVTPASAGELIDVIPAGNPLLNPIDGSTITLDVVGNPREDGNGKRDIGARQLALAPFISVNSSTDSQVTLNWNEPLHHDGLTIVRYELVYDVSGGSSPTTHNITDLTHTVSGLTNGTAYEFKVRAVYDNGGGEENGLYSNIVNATPYGPVANPTLNAYPTNGEVNLTWNLPDLGGRQFYYYVVRWYLSGDINIVGFQPIYDISTLSYAATGLTNGTAYDFTIQVVALYDESDVITSTATPFVITDAPTVTATPGDTEVALSWTLPDLGGGVFSYYVVRWYLSGDINIEGFLPPITNSNTLSTTITGLTNGQAYDFKVQVVANGGESPEGVATATPDVGLGIDDLDLLNGKFSYYPNPVDDYLHIDIEENFTAKLFSINGALLMDIKSKKIIDVSKFNTGIYILQIQVENKTYSGKILKK